jgi:hypothetical protein
MSQFHDQFHDPIDRALFACRLWLHAGFVGVCAVAAGLLLLVDGEPKWLPGVLLILAGLFVAAVSWRRARKMLERAWRVTAPGAATVSSRNGPEKNQDRSPISVSGLSR